MYQTNNRPAQSENEHFPIITVNNQNGDQAVSARNLYQFLEITERFSKWFDRMVSYGFVEGLDYTPYQMVHPLNNQEITDYVLTLDTAKEISMLQKSEKGKQARRYFIEIDKKYRVVKQKSVSTDFIDARDLVFGFVELKGKKIRHIIIDEKDFYSINDIHDAIGAKTNGNQVAKKLNAKKQLAQKIYIFGSTNPSWFTTGLGMQLILQGSRVLKSNALIS